MRITVDEKPNDDHIALSNIDGVVTEYAPQKIHFIWVGGPIPAKYLQSIISLNIALHKNKNNNIEIIIWTDKLINIDASMVYSDNNHALRQFSIKSLENDLFPKMEEDPFYVASEDAIERLKLFKLFIALESKGASNFATVADLLRLEILRQFGGCYIDVDTNFDATKFDVTTKDEGKNLSVLPEYLPHGFRCNTLITYNSRNQDGEYFVDNYESNYTNNDIIIAMQDSDFIKKAIIGMLALVKTLVIPKNTPIGNKFIANYYDFKRNKEYKNWFSRRQQTLTFGPTNISKVIDEVLKKELDGKDIPTANAGEIFDHFTLQKNSNRLTVFGVCVETRCDNNWLPKEGDSKPRSYSL